MCAGITGHALATQAGTPAPIRITQVDREAAQTLDSEIVEPHDRPSTPGRLDFPRRRPGLWELRNSASEQLGVPPVQFCVGEQTDTMERHLDRQNGKKGACNAGPFKRSGINWVAESVCKDSRSTVINQSIASGDFQTRYRIDTLVFYSPPLANNKREDREFVEARYLGPCPDNQKSGDLTIPGLGVLNMQDGALRPEAAKKQR
ncbi:MAG: hypothetical protein Q4A16_04550 [Lautropia sp.]|nr:hypothetical protein [Lautropia sp.]